MPVGRRKPGRAKAHAVQPGQVVRSRVCAQCASRPAPAFEVRKMSHQKVVPDAETGKGVSGQTVCANNAQIKRPNSLFLSQAFIELPPQSKKNF